MALNLLKCYSFIALIVSVSGDQQPLSLNARSNGVLRRFNFTGPNDVDNVLGISQVIQFIHYSVLEKTYMI